MPIPTIPSLFGFLPLFLLSAPSPARAAPLPQDWETLRLDNASAEGGEVRVTTLDDGSFRIDEDGETARLRLELATALGGIRALRLEALPDDSLPHGGPGRAPNGNFVLAELRVSSVVGRNVRRLELAFPSASYAQVGWPAHAAIDGRDDTGWAIDGAQGLASEAVFPLAEPLGRGARTLLLELDFGYDAQHSIGRLRVSASATEAARAASPSGGAGELPLAIGGAIDKAVGWVLSQQELDGSWANEHALYPAGGTALCVYALLKSGVPADHPSIRRALAFLDATPPRRTYSAGCAMLAYSALGPDLGRDRAVPVLRDLLDWQDGDWGYPGAHQDPRANHRDLSNTQYGALGLWAAEGLGLEVPPYAWKRLAEAVLRYQGKADGAAGFGYTPGGKPTGSMTAAGVGVLALCATRVEQDLAKEIEPAIERGLAWLDEYFDPTKNPDGPDDWREYFLYGMERVAAFTGRDLFNDQEWYREGSRALIKTQRGEGPWDRRATPQPVTAFALLFLTRASAPSTGPGAGRKQPTYGVDDPYVPVNLRAAGDTPLQLWISSFGDELLRDWTFEGEDGPRVALVEYVTSGGVLVPDGGAGGAEWRTSTKPPPEGWTAPDFDDRRWSRDRSGFGPRDSRDLVVATPWDSEELWLRHAFEVDAEALVEPRLDVLFTSPATAAPGPRGELVKLFDEELDFAALLTGGGGDTRIATQRGGAPSGDAYLRVDGRQRFNARIPGWGFSLREKPEAGEFRFLRLTWRKRAGGGVMVQVAIDGAWGRALRYHAGDGDESLGPARQVEKRPPAHWDELTVDLWQDLGGDGFVTGIALTPLEGEADFDALYLGRTRSALSRAGRLSDAPLEWGVAEATSRKSAEAGALALWINGEPALELDVETRGFETLLDGKDLVRALRPGRNVIAAHVRNGAEARAFDLALRDARCLARVAGDPERPAGHQRFAARVSFAWPGPHVVRARVHVVDEAGGDTRVFESSPLKVTIEGALPPEMLAYASDAGRSVLADGVEAVSASSALENWPPQHLLDGKQQRGWLCAPGDPTPSFHVELDRPARADTLLLSPLRPDRSREGASPARVAVVVNGKGAPLVAEVSAHPLQKTRVDLGDDLKVRTIEVRVLERRGGGRSLPSVGFAEVELVSGANKR